MARQKFIYDTHRIGHLWFHKIQGQARNPGDNFYFVGDVIYSYGSHFPIARHCQHNGRKFVLFTTGKYSNTTVGHISIVWGAIDHHSARVFRVADVMAKPAAVLAGLRQRVADARKPLADARNIVQRVARWETLKYAIETANEFCEFIGYKTRLPLPADAESRDVEAIEYRAVKQSRDTAREESRRIKYAAERAESARQSLLDNAEIIAEWREGRAAISGYHQSSRLPTMLRITGDDVETSRGATFPVAHAIRLLAVVNRIMATGQDWQADDSCPMRLGHYQIDAISADGTIRAGCHTIDRAEIDHFRNLLTDYQSVASRSTAVQ